MAKKMVTPDGRWVVELVSYDGVPTFKVTEDGYLPYGGRSMRHRDRGKFDTIEDVAEYMGDAFATLEEVE